MAATAAVYGNYKGYQGSARTTTGSNTSSNILDERLGLVSTAVPSIFSHSRVLDIGCNDGRVAVDIALHFGPAAVTGLDPDGALIVKAKSHLSFRWSRLGPNGEVDYYPASAVQKTGHVPYPLDEGGEGLPHCVRFAKADFVDWEGAGEGSCSTVLMLSVVKWIHLEHGDEGLTRAFAKVAALLEVGGHFVFEPQDAKSYETAVKKNPRLKEKKAALKIEPEDFTRMLEEVGLELVHEIGGRKRSIGIWRKK